MLPSSGYFKNISCPFYGSSFCERPHCHFKHEKKETPIPPTALPIYHQVYGDISGSAIENKSDLLQYYSDAIKKLQDELQSGSELAASSSEKTTNSFPTYVPTPVNKIPTYSHSSRDTAKACSSLNLNGISSNIEEPGLQESEVLAYKPTPISELKRLKGITENEYVPSPVARKSSKSKKRRNHEEYDPTKVVPSIKKIKKPKPNDDLHSSDHEIDGTFDDSSMFTDDDSQSNIIETDASPCLTSDTNSASLSNEQSKSQDGGSKYDIVNKILLECKRTEEIGVTNKTEEILKKVEINKNKVDTSKTDISQASKPKGFYREKESPKNCDKNKILGSDDLSIEKLNSVEKLSSDSSNSLNEPKIDKSCSTLEKNKESKSLESKSKIIDKSKQNLDKINSKPEKSAIKSSKDSSKCMKDASKSEKDQSKSKKDKSKSNKTKSKSDGDKSEKMKQESSKSVSKSDKSGSKEDKLSSKTSSKSGHTKVKHKDSNTHSKPDKHASSSHKYDAKSKTKSEKPEKDKHNSKSGHDDEKRKDGNDGKKSDKAKSQEKSEKLKDTEKPKTSHEHSEKSESTSKKSRKDDKIKSNEKNKVDSRKSKSLHKNIKLKSKTSSLSSKSKNETSDQEIKYRSDKTTCDSTSAPGPLVSTINEESDVLFNASESLSTNLFKNIEEKLELEKLLEEYGSELDDHDTEAECWQIFNEEQLSMKVENTEKKSHFANDVKESNDPLFGKKRLAHKPSFIRNSKPAKKDILSPAEALNVRYQKFQEMYKKSHPEPEKPLSPPSFVSPSSSANKKRIAHVSNPALIAAASRRISSKSLPVPSPDAKTIVSSGNYQLDGTVATTNPKGAKRIAHIPSEGVLSRPIIPVQPGNKVPHNTRQRYLNCFIDECLKFSKTAEEAYKKALEEENIIFTRCSNKTVYLSLAVNTVRKLRNGGIDTSSKSSNDKQLILAQKQTVSHEYILAGAKASKTTYSIERKPKTESILKGPILFKLMTEYLLTQEQLEENGYPLLNPDNPGQALFKKLDLKKRGNLHNPLEKICCRCQKWYKVNVNGNYVTNSSCSYHWGRLYKRKVAGSWQSRYSCCDGDHESIACCEADGHVHEEFDPDKISGFMKTFSKPEPEDGNYGVYALDCEMSYTTQGVELTRVTVIGEDLKPVYETFVKPENKVLDYNTRFSGITADDLKNVDTTLRDVQAVLLSMFSEKTILIGHSLESDLRALRLIHYTVVDTAMVFPHKNGPPFKRALRTLVAEYLKKIIQNSVEGHDSQEDAASCMELMLWKVKQDMFKRR